MNVMPESTAPTASPPSPPPVSPTRRRRWPWVVAVVVLVVVGVLVVADRVTVGIAEDRVADTIVDSASEYHAAADKTHVDIKGFPFLTQVARGRFGKVNVTMRDVTVEQFRVFRLDASLSTVRVPRSVMTGSRAEDLKIDRVVASGVISPREFAAALNVPELTLRAEAGKLRASGFVSFGGVRTHVDALLRPFINGDRIRLELLEFEAGSQLAPSVLQVVKNYLAQGVAAPQLPFEVKLTDITADGENIRISGEARNVNV